MDLPTVLEANWITNAISKTLWVSAYILVYGVRPVLVRPKSMGVLPSPAEVPAVPVLAACAARPHVPAGCCLLPTSAFSRFLGPSIFMLRMSAMMSAAHDVHTTAVTNSSSLSSLTRVGGHAFCCLWSGSQQAAAASVSLAGRTPSTVTATQTSPHDDGSIPAQGLQTL